jgi:hypothetical protein
MAERILTQRELNRAAFRPVGCTNTIFLQIHGSASGEFRNTTPSLERDRLSWLMEAEPNSHSDAHVLGPAGHSYPTMNLCPWVRGDPAAVRSRSAFAS